MTNAASKPYALMQFTQLSNDVLDNPRLAQLKNIIFVLVLLNYGSKAYNKVMVGGPIRAFKDFKAHVIKVSIAIFPMILRISIHPFSSSLSLNNFVVFLQFKPRLTML